MEVLVTVDVLLVMGVLQLVGLDVLPEGLDDAGAGLSVNAKQASQARVQLKLGRLWKRRNHITTLFLSFPFFFFTTAAIRAFTADTLIIFPPRPNLKTDVRFDNGVLNALPHVSVDWWLSEM